ncbi:hypothetical protein SAY86_004288 [Trapa natans]|uniref:Uncharacterized protein n=1 Tax=Trapa natans TaxID=22666 RepID=A0AAN7N3X5_TRANT|nr:hypothetical protein SAY86_004288 [Trapa natans]
MMKKLIRRLSRVADSTAQYCLLQESGGERRPNQTPRSRVESFRAALASSKLRRRNSSAVPAGFVPVYVGEEMERFVVNAELLNHPVLVGLLEMSAQEYGYEQKGPLKIPCHVLVFERVLEALRLGDETGDLEDLISAISIDDS